MAFLDNFKNALRPYDDDDYIENEATEEETAAFEPVAEPQPAPEKEEYSEPKPKFGKKSTEPTPLRSRPPLPKRRGCALCSSRPRSLTRPPR